jgi:hypothetical protein
MKNFTAWLLTILLLGPFVLAYGSSLLRNPDFDAITDVSVGSPADNDVAKFNSASGDWESDTDSVTEDYILVIHDEAQNTDGGGFTCGGGFVTRTLDNEVVDTGSHSSLASNAITLGAGTYRISARAAAFDVDEHTLRWQDTDAPSTIVEGDSADSPAGVQTWAHLNGRFTIASSTVFELQHECTTTQATDGFGQATNLGVETYAVVELWREGSGPINFSFSGALVRKTANESIANNTFVSLSFNTEEFDVGGWHDNATNNSRLTVPTGVTRIKVCSAITFASDTTGQRVLRILKGGTIFNGMPAIDLNPSSGDVLLSTCSGPLVVVATDFFEVSVLQNSGGALNILASPSNSDTWFSVEALN